MLGFAMRAGKIIAGTDLVCKAMKGGSVRLAVISSEASDSTKKKLVNKCEFYGVRFVMADIDTGELARIIGKSFAAAAVAVTDEGFAAEIIKLFE